MTTLSTVAKLPRPELTDTPNAPAAFNALTNALDPLVIPKFASAAARDAAIPSPAAGQHAYLTDSHTLMSYHAGLGRWVSHLAYVGMPYSYAEDGTDIVVSTGTPTAGSPVVGVTFVVPPSGIVLISVTGYMETTNNGNSTILGYEVRTGGTIGSGTVVQAPDMESRSVVAGRGVVTSGPATSNGTHRRPLTLLTPGATYNVRTMHWGSPNGAGYARFRSILVEPV